MTDVYVEDINSSQRHHHARERQVFLSFLGPLWGTIELVWNGELGNERTGGAGGHVEGVEGVVSLMGIPSDACGRSHLYLRSELSCPDKTTKWRLFTIHEEITSERHQGI